MRRHGPVIAHCTDSEDFPKYYVYFVDNSLLFPTVKEFSKSADR